MCWTRLSISYEKRDVSAHRNPEWMTSYATQSEERGLQFIVSGAVGAAHLPGILCAQTLLPVIVVPVKTYVLVGQESLLSIVQKPRGVTVATLAIGGVGVYNAGLLAAEIFANHDAEMRICLIRRREKIRKNLLEVELP